VKFDKTKTAAGSIMYLSRLLTDKASPAGRESLPSLVVATVCIVVEDCSITHECPRVTSHLQRSAGGVPLSLLLAASCPLVQRLIYSYVPPQLIKTSLYRQRWRTHRCQTTSGTMSLRPHRDRCIFLTSPILHWRSSTSLLELWACWTTCSSSLFSPCSSKLVTRYLLYMSVYFT